MFDTIIKYKTYIHIAGTIYNIYYNPLFYISYHYILTKDNIKYIMKLKRRNAVIKSEL